MNLRLSVALAAVCLFFGFTSVAKADEQWNLNYSGTDGYGDTLSIVGTITTAPGTSPLTIDGIDISFTQDGVPGCSNCDTSDSSTTLQTSYGENGAPDNLLYTSGPLVDADGLGFLLASGSGGGDFNGNDVLYFDSSSNSYCVPSADEPTFCGTLTVMPTAAPTPEPPTAVLLGSGIIMLFAGGILTGALKLGAPTP